MDQVTKALVRQKMSFGESINVIPGYFNIALSKNTGAAFGAMPAWTPLIIIISFAAIYAIVKLRRARSHSRILALALGFLIGGAMGNLIDRIMYGYVTDFLDFHVVRDSNILSWPTFNVADIAITIGMILLLYYVYVVEKRTEH